ncbi:hypothetical protein ILUMI_17268, partial [Ignelater luminosus]
ITQKDVLQRVCVSSGNSVNVRAIYKWGCDGAAGQQNYKQRFVDSDHNHDDSFMFVVSCRPIRLVDENDTILWQNNRPSSTKFCRPIKITFQKETEPVEATTDSSVFVVTHSLHLTMIDGKIGRILTGTSASKCFICKANPKAMNSLQSHSQRATCTEKFLEKQQWKI